MSQHSSLVTVNIISSRDELIKLVKLPFIWLINISGMVIRDHTVGGILFYNRNLEKITWYR